MKWFLTENFDGSGAILEVSYAFDLYLSDWYEVLLELTADEVKHASSSAIEWVSVAPPRSK
jgi:hypothetical protein